MDRAAAAVMDHPWLCAGAAVVVLAPQVATCVAAGLMRVTATRRCVQRMARRRMIKRLQKAGVTCPKVTGQEPKLSTDIDYPEYYLREYHAYPEGNLCWEAAVEADAMSISAAMVAYPEKGKDADAYMHGLIMSCIPEDVRRTAVEVLDAGCGVGQSTFPLAAALPRSKVTAVDLSPHFLHVARQKDADRRMSWTQAKLEDLPRDWAGRFDLVTLIGVTHELPTRVMRESVAELHRVLKPGGTLIAVDINKANVRRMPRFVYTMFKSTEPDMDDFMSADIPEEVSKAGFKVEVNTDVVKRRVIVIGTK
eukprot:TRINITY_DN13294_c0_g1_i1.p1 TRINITY_DN13294_c0_g1~~TRINITY_DN13294_c0_g1_i1.p1  ORF type:complete len:327 (+),score=80.02 TRINITY_DN13294_c0_g1_i1:58-981(+)